MTSGPTPPVLPGLPLLGHALALRRDPISLVWRGYRRYGRVFAIRLGWQPIAVILGPEHHRFFFEQTDALLSMREVYKFVIPMFGAVLQAAEPKDCAGQRAIVRPAFRPDAMDRYIAIMVRETAAWIDALGDHGEFDLWDTFEQLSMNIAARAVLGDAFRDRTAAGFWALYRDLAGGMEFVLPTNLPIPRFRRRDRAKAELFRMIGQMIAQRRARPDHHRDVLTTLAQGRDCEGRELADDTIAGLVLGLIFAAYDTTAAQTCWALVQLLQHPHWCGHVLNELRTEVPAGIDADRLRRLKRLEASLKETVRTRPITTMLWRHTSVPYDVDGYHVPRGWITMICPAVSQQLADIFPDPATYDPARFAAERGDASGTFAFANFGGGAHKCLGIQFAYNEMKIILALLLRSYAIALTGPVPQPDFSMGIMRPASPCLIRYRRRDLRSDSNDGEETSRTAPDNASIRTACNMPH